MANKKQRNKRDIIQVLENEGWEKAGKKAQRQLRKKKRELKRFAE